MQFDPNLSQPPINNHVQVANKPGSNFAAIRAKLAAEKSQSAFVETVPQNTISLPKGDLHNRNVTNSPDLSLPSSLLQKPKNDIKLELDIKDKNIMVDKKLKFNEVNLLKSNQEIVNSAYCISIKNGKLQTEKLTYLDSSKLKKYSEDKNKIIGFKEGNQFKISSEHAQKLQKLNINKIEIEGEKLEIGILTEEEAKQFKGAINSYIENKKAAENEEKKNKTDVRSLPLKINGKLTDKRADFDEKKYVQRFWSNLAELKAEIGHIVSQERRINREEFLQFLNSLDKHKDLLRTIVKHNGIKEDTLRSFQDKKTILNHMIKLLPIK